jgi:hypothetical protein
LLAAAIAALTTNIHSDYSWSIALGKTQLGATVVYIIIIRELGTCLRK